MLGLLFTKDHFKITIGVGKYIKIKHGRVQLHFSPVQSSYGIYSHQYTDNHTNWVKAIILFGGPLTTLFLVVGLLVLLSFNAYKPVDILLKITIAQNIFVLIVTMLPIKYPAWYGNYAGMNSDFRQILHVLRPEHKK